MASAYLKERVCHLLNIDSQLYEDAASRLDFERKGPNLIQLESSKNAEVLDSFFNNSPSGTTLVFFTKKEVDPVLLIEAQKELAAAEVEDLKQQTEGTETSAAAQQRKKIEELEPSLLLDFASDVFPKNSFDSSCVYVIKNIDGALVDKSDMTNGCDFGCVTYDSLQNLSSLLEGSISHEKIRRF